MSSTKRDLIMLQHQKFEQQILHDSNSKVEPSTKVTDSTKKLTFTDKNASWLRSEEGRKQTMAITAIKRIGVPDDIADVASFLASDDTDDSRWVTGQRIEVSGGAHL